MDRTNNSLNVKINGKNLDGAPFQEFVKVEPFGNFGLLIHTKQPLRLSDVMHICSPSGKALASAEVVWVRGGDEPAVEVLLHRNLDLSEIANAQMQISQTPVQSTTPYHASESATAKTTNLSTSSASNGGLSAAAAPSTSAGSATSKSGSASSPAAANADQGAKETIACPSCNKMNPIGSVSCKFCGGYITRTSGAVSRKTIDTAKTFAPNSASIPKPDTSLSSTPPPAPTTTLGTKKSREAREGREGREAPASAPTKVTSKQAADKLATLKQFRKIAMVSLVLLIILLAGALFPIGSAALSPTPIDVVAQQGCVDINLIKSQAVNGVASGNLEYWTQSDNGGIQFFRRDNITASDAIAEIDKINKGKTRMHGCWCPKSATPASTAQLPDILTLPWSFKPVGANTSANDLTLQLKDKTFVFKENAKQALLDRTGDISKATFYSGMQKLVLQFDTPTAKLDAPVMKEMTFFLPSNQDPTAVADGRLTNSVHQIYLGQPNPQEANALGIRQILALIVGCLIAANLTYLGFNFYRARNL